MSETKMIMFPRELGDDLAELIATRARVCGGGAYEIWEAICEGFGKPSEQHQGEPVVLPAKRPRRMNDQRDDAYDNGWNNCLDEIAKLGPLYTHADPGEVERLHKEHIKALEACSELSEKQRDHWMAECKKRDAKLAEWDALLRDLEGKTILSWADKRRISAALSASAEQSAPVERDDFWSWLDSAYRDGSEGEAPKFTKYNMEVAYRAGQARAALERKPSVADDDQPCDLATWKRRAIEAKSKLRTYDPQVVELGERAMQAILVDPKPAQLVLTKCRLCDQLQSDLTARDEEVDGLRHDAERYRWLCDRFGVTKLPCAVERILAGDVYVADGKSGVDAAIDAAMATEVHP